MWWVITQLGWSVSPFEATIYATTNIADFLSVAYSYHEPARHPIYRIVRGTRKFCGYKYIWDTPFIVNQTEPGDTLTHSFHLAPLLPSSTIWFYPFAPGGPYGLEIQGPLLHFETPEAPPCLLLREWTFDVDLQGWRVGAGTVTWINEGSPLPGSLRLSGVGSTRCRSPFFNSSAVQTMPIKLWARNPSAQQWGFQLVIGQGGVFHILKSFEWIPTTWTQYTVEGAEAWKGPLTQVRCAKDRTGVFDFDTVQVYDCPPGALP